jgi:hypothetical protein
MDIHYSDTPGTSHVAALGGVTVAVDRCDAGQRGTRSAARGRPSMQTRGKACHRAGSPYSAAVRWQPRCTPCVSLHVFNNSAGPISGHHSAETRPRFVAQRDRCAQGRETTILSPYGRAFHPQYSKVPATARTACRTGARPPHDPPTARGGATRDVSWVGVGQRTDGIRDRLA